jgi:hypothetical protein
VIVVLAWASCLDSRSLFVLNPRPCPASGGWSTIRGFWSGCAARSASGPGAYRLARLAVKYGAEILLDDLIVRLSSDCPWRDEPRGSCGARFSDLPPRRPPDMPARAMRVIAGGKR